MAPTDRDLFASLPSFSRRALVGSGPPRRYCAWVRHPRSVPGRRVPLTQRPGAPGCSTPSMNCVPLPRDPTSARWMSCSTTRTADG